MDVAYLLHHMVERDNVRTCDTCKCMWFGMPCGVIFHELVNHVFQSVIQHHCYMTHIHMS